MPVSIVTARNLLLMRGGGATYMSKVLSYSPIAYWPMNEASGAVAINYGTLGVAANGAYTGVTLGQTGIGDGGTAPQFDGANDLLSLNTAALKAAFNGNVGTLMLWLLCDNWVSGLNKYGIYFSVDASNYYHVKKDNTNNKLEFVAGANGVSGSIDKTVFSPAGWFVAFLSWSTAATLATASIYVGGVDQLAVGNTVAIGNNFVGTLDTLAIGSANDVAAVLPWLGKIAHVALWTTELSDATKLALATLL